MMIKEVVRGILIAGILVVIYLANIKVLPKSQDPWSDVPKIYGWIIAFADLAFLAVIFLWAFDIM